MGASCIQFGGTAQGPMGVYRSDDKAESWKAVTAYPTTQGVKSIAGVKVYRLFPDPNDANSFYLGTRGQGLFYTYDNGTTWQMAEQLSGRYIYSVAVDHHDKCTIYVTDGPGIYKTTDCSRTWQTVYTEGRPDQRLVGLAADVQNSSIIYGALVGGDILMSADSGASWRIVKRFGFNVEDISVDPLNPGRIYVAAYKDGLYRSDNRGGSWTNLSQGLNAYTGSTQFYRLIFNPAQRDSLFWVSKYGILRSDDAGSSWTDLKLITPPGSVNIYAFGINPQNQSEMYYTGTVLGDKNANIRSTFYRSTDGGKTWVTKKLPTNTIPVSLMINKNSPSTLLLGFTVAN
jgi:photosystem II stability/assembly factor-like uncharacterized protein